MKISASSLLLMLAACQAAQPEQPHNFADPAVAEALGAPIMSGVSLGAASSSDALRPADQPATMQIPADTIVDTRGAITLYEVAQARAHEAAFAGCNPVVVASVQWSIRLPPWIELPDDARVAEAAGSDGPDCSLRIVRFGIVATPRQAMARYARVAKEAGFLVTTGNASLTATRKQDGAAFRVDVAAIADGTRIDLTSKRVGNNRGR